MNSYTKFLILHAFLFFTNSVNAQRCFDLDHNSKVDFADFILFAQNYGHFERYNKFQDFLDFRQAYGEYTDCSRAGSVGPVQYPEPSEYTVVYPTPRVNVVNITPSSIQFSLKLNNMERALHYRIKRSSHPVPIGLPISLANKITYPSLDSTAYTVEPLLAETRYEFRVSVIYATRDMLKFAHDAIIKVTTPMFIAPGPPIMVFVGYGYDGQTAFIKWSRHPSISTYRIFKDGEVYVPWLNPATWDVVPVRGLRSGISSQIVGESRDIYGNRYMGKPLTLCLGCD